jgi:uncharacterized membrane protein
VTALRAVWAHRDLTLAVAAAAACALLVILLPWEGARMVAAVPLALLLPGYAITAASFAGRAVEASMTLLLSIALSLSALTIASLLLHPFDGLRRVPWALLLAAVVLAGCVVAARRRGGSSSLAVLRRRPRLRPLDAALLAGAVLALGATAAISATTLPADKAASYTRLWMLPYENRDHGGMRIGVVSQERKPHNFVLELRVGKRRHYTSFFLEPGQARLLRRRFEPPPADRTKHVVAILYRGNGVGTPYRRVNGWIPAA